MSWLALTATPVVLLFIGFATWDSLTCADGPQLNRFAAGPSAQCANDAAVFTLAAGCLLLLAAVGASQVSNRGFLATYVLPVLAAIVAVWASLQSGTSPSPLLALPVMAAWVSGIACISGSGASAR